MAVLVRALVLLLACLASTHAAATHAPTHAPTQPPPTTHRPYTPEERVQHLETVAEQLSRQLMLQQLYVEERTRSEGDSGIKQIRERQDGSKPYFTSTWSNVNSMAAMHDHTDHQYTIGLGEMVAVLNGLEFRTRHNDFRINQPSHTSKDYGATEDIPYPQAPHAVTNKHTLDEQIAEMKEWFKAWRDGNHTHRDYRPYFPSLLCYLEGAWNVDTKTMEEPFHSDRHSIDASSWFDLMEKIRFTSYTGDKSNKQNFAYLPTTIINVTDGVPVFAQWNYRILCHKTKSYVERSELQPMESLGVRMARRKSFDQYLNTRAARFRIEDLDHDHASRFSRLDELMGEIPGKDNYGANITDHTFGLAKYEAQTDNLLNVANYHRWFRVLESGAMGEKTAKRGYADRSLFVARNTQEKVAAVSLGQCHNVGQPHHRHKECHYDEQRVSYAIPLEIVYLTPLNAWNPYDIEIKGDWHHSNIRDNGRTGRNTQAEAFNGTDTKSYYLTPAAMFAGAELDRDPADTAKGAAGVLDRHGNLRSVKASGVRITLPNIPDVGVLRTRFPIMPTYSEGNPIWKELEALRDVVMDMRANHNYLKSAPVMEPPTTPTTPAPHGNHNHHDAIEQSEALEVDIPSVLITEPSTPEPAGLHAHAVHLTEHDYHLLHQGRVLTVTTSEDNGHSHRLLLAWSQDKGKVTIVSCDDAGASCLDGHSGVLEAEETGLHTP